MKTALLILLVLMTALSSCYKTHYCECTYFTYDSSTKKSTANRAEQKMGKKLYKDASKECRENIPLLYPSDSQTYSNTSCKLMF